MHSRARFSLVGAVAAVATVAATPATAAMISFDSDSSFLASAFNKLGGGNVRWGNGAGSGDWEYSVVDGSDFPLGTPLNRSWTSGADNFHDLLFSYNSSGDVSLDIGATAGASTGSIPAGANTLLIRAKAGTDQSAFVGDPIDVTFDVGGSATLGPLVGDSNAEYVGLIDSRLANGFSLEALSSNLNDAGNGRGSLPAYQIKVGTTPVPAPATLALLGLGLLGLVTAARRRSD